MSLAPHITPSSGHDGEITIHATMFSNNGTNSVYQQPSLPTKAWHSVRSMCRLETKDEAWRSFFEVAGCAWRSDDPEPLFSAYGRLNDSWLFPSLGHFSQGTEDKRHSPEIRRGTIQSIASCVTREFHKELRPTQLQVLNTKDNLSRDFFTVSHHFGDTGTASVNSHVPTSEA